MGFDKLAAELNGKSVLSHAVDLFLECEAVAEIILVCPEERFATLDHSRFNKPVRRVDGGTERYLSVANGLAAIAANTNLIAVHDAARPFTSQCDILATIAAAEEHRAASLARRVTETLKRSDNNDFTEASIPREDLWFMETPQIFHADLIRAAYQHIVQNQIPVTDESSAIEAYGERVKLIASTSPNPKITTPADLFGIEPKLGSPHGH